MSFASRLLTALTSSTETLNPGDINIAGYLADSGFGQVELGNIVMIILGAVMIYLAVKKDYEPLLLLPIGFGIIAGNMPYNPELIPIGYLDELGGQQSVFKMFYFGVSSGLFPPLIFLGIGAMTDFSALLSNPKLLLLGAAAQIGIFVTLLGSLFLGFNMQEAAAIGIIGGADGPTAIFVASQMAPHLLGAIAIAAYSYMGLVPVIQPPIMRLLTTKEERRRKMKPARKVSQTEKILFPIIAFLITAFIAPGAITLLGMLFFGNLLKESGVTRRLADSAQGALNNIVVIILGFSVGTSTQARYFLTMDSIKIFILGALSFAIATAGGVLFAKFMNLFLKGDSKLNPLVGAAGVSAVPDSARVVEVEGRKYDKTNHLLMHAMAPNVAGVIGSAIAAGVLLSLVPH
ncbi:MAG TPA: sodium ion-translocating decarboxylase subunit beta [Candidatus Sabulitectum sp.]|mgnify:CR=1 FL=1|nr:sodium ion-translocating decarboxylase subunit beta [Candidatus Sabulitectum sp.]HPJ29172.1 sodium ion-translocating decarboxylase subunit beta [Candidatus Sabulitectum sp.]HPR23022.1 sodium ion-translocating decarboxylase subunit beta [Candidatus Sabulitectum sp.]HRW77990.1 sodium ion-translocating decarboxylase subunit beta [Candidatus Sabulitectum sp.]